MQIATRLGGQGMAEGSPDKVERGAPLHLGGMEQS